MQPRPQYLYQEISTSPHLKLYGCIVYAYNWDGETIQPYNFKCGDVEISWYKYCGRGCTMNSQHTIYEMIDMYDRCIKKLEEMNKDAEDEDCN